jgi:hypothetical protein
MREHSAETPKSLAEWKLSTERWLGFTLEFHQLLVHVEVGSEVVTLRSNFKSASSEIDRRGGILGDWAVRNEHALLFLFEATLVLVDGAVARISFTKEPKMKTFNKDGFEYQLKEILSALEAIASRIWAMAEAGSSGDLPSGIPEEGKTWSVEGGKLIVRDAGVYVRGYGMSHGVWVSTFGTHTELALGIAEHHYWFDRPWKKLGFTVGRGAETVFNFESPRSDMGLGDWLNLFVRGEGEWEAYLPA